jgi:hypothetical protein
MALTVWNKPKEQLNISFRKRRISRGDDSLIICKYHWLGIIANPNIFISHCKSPSADGLSPSAHSFHPWSLDRRRRGVEERGSQVLHGMWVTWSTSCLFSDWECSRVRPLACLKNPLPSFSPPLKSINSLQTVFLTQSISTCLQCPLPALRLCPKDPPPVLKKRVSHLKCVLWF